MRRAGAAVALVCGVGLGAAVAASASPAPTLRVVTGYWDFASFPTRDACGAAWCGHHVPAALRRSLRIPRLSPGASCPVSTQTQTIGGAVGGALVAGNGPVYVAMTDKSSHVVYTRNRYGRSPWYGSNSCGLARRATTAPY